MHDFRLVEASGYEYVLTKERYPVCIGRVDLNRRLANDYRDLLLYGEIFVPEGGRVLFLGAGPGGHLAQWRGLRPDVIVEGCDPDKRCIQLAREHYGLVDDDGFRLHCQTAEDLLDGNDLSHRFDLIVLDIYDDAYLPLEVSNAEFLNRLVDFLMPQGRLAINLVGSNLQLLPYTLKSANQIRALLACLPPVCKDLQFYSTGLNIVVSAGRAVTRPLTPPCADPTVRELLHYQFAGQALTIAPQTLALLDSDRPAVNPATFSIMDLVDETLERFLDAMGEMPVTTSLAESWEAVEFGDLPGAFYWSGNALTESWQTPLDSPIRPFTLSWLGECWDGFRSRMPDDDIEKGKEICQRYMLETAGDDPDLLNATDRVFADMLRIDLRIDEALIAYRRLQEPKS